MTMGVVITKTVGRELRSRLMRRRSQGRSGGSAWKDLMARRCESRGSRETPGTLRSQSVSDIGSVICQGDVGAHTAGEDAQSEGYM